MGLFDGLIRSVCNAPSHFRFQFPFPYPLITRGQSQCGNDVRVSEKECPIAAVLRKGERIVWPHPATPKCASYSQIMMQIHLGSKPWHTLCSKSPSVELSTQDLIHAAQMEQHATMEAWKRFLAMREKDDGYLHQSPETQCVS